MGLLNNLELIAALNRDGVHFETLEVTDEVQGLQEIPANAKSALIQVESDVADKAIRYREDGGDPTSTVGMFVGNGGPFDLCTRKCLENFKVIQATAGTTQLNITYYK